MAIKLGEIDLVNGQATNTPQEIFNLVHPIGETYVQYGGCPAPSVLYNNSSISSTWTEISGNFANRYPKISGTDAAGTAQGEQLPNITGDYNPVVYGFNAECVYAVSCNWASGAFYLSPNKFPTNNVCASQTGIRVNPQYNTAFDARRCSTVYTNNGAVRPLTTTVKIWKRTA